MKSQRPLIQETYKEYTPPVNVANAVQTLLAYVPSKYLAGLDQIVLTNAASLSQERRRQKTALGSPTPNVKGLYHQLWNGQPAWIEIFVDNTLQEWPSKLIKLPFFRNYALSEALYHEIGHHIQFTKKLQFGDGEAFAEQYESKLFRLFFRKRYWYLQPIIFPLRVIYKFAAQLYKGKRKNKASKP